MAINWFPGHMHKARKEIKKVMPQMDLIIEVVDARIPFSSENPLVPSLRGDTPLIKVLNKRDLADPVITEQWLAWLEQERGVRAVTLTHNQRQEALGILKLAAQRSRGALMLIPVTGQLANSIPKFCDMLLRPFLRR